MATNRQLKNQPRQGFNGFDYFVIAGGLVNAVVICLLLGFWLFN